MQKVFSQQGLTLLELTVVLLILIGLAGLVVPYIGNTGSMAMCQTTDATMQAVKEAIMGGPSGAGFYADLLGEYPRDRGIPRGYTLHYLFMRDDGLDNDGDTHMPSRDGVTNVDPDDEWRAYNAKTGVGWRGPYLQSGVTNAFPVDGRAADTGIAGSGTDGAGDNNLTNELHTSFDDPLYVHVPVAEGDQVALDGWGRPIILQVPPDADCPAYSSQPGACARLVSAGPIPGREIQSNGIDTLISDITATNRNNPNDPEGQRYTNNDRVLYLRISDPAPGGNIPCDQI